jgi:hypothetical protein
VSPRERLRRREREQPGTPPSAGRARRRGALPREQLAQRPSRRAAPSEGRIGNPSLVGLPRLPRAPGARVSRGPCSARAEDSQSMSDSAAPICGFRWNHCLSPELGTSWGRPKAVAASLRTCPLRNSERRRSGVGKSRGRPPIGMGPSREWEGIGASPDEDVDDAGTSRPRFVTSSDGDARARGAARGRRTLRARLEAQ